MANIPIAHIISQRLARKARTKRTATAGRSACPLRRSTRALRASWPCLTTMTSAELTERCRSCVRPSNMTPTPSTVYARSQASAKAWPWSCSMQSMLSSAFPASRILGRIAASSRVPRRPRAHARGPRARKSATPLSSGPFPKPPACCCVTMQPAKRLWPAWTRNLGKARLCRFSRTNWRAQCTTCSTVQWPLP